MSLNDPFGRVSRRQKTAYHRLSEQLRQQGVLTPSAVHRAQRNLRQTGLRLLAVIVVAAVVGGLLFPEMQALIALTGALVLLWLGTSYLQTRNHLNTYARELGDAVSTDTRHNPDKTTEEKDPP